VIAWCLLRRITVTIVEIAAKIVWFIKNEFVICVKIDSN